MKNKISVAARKARPYGQGAVKLVLVGSMAMLTACAPHPDDVPEDMARSLYTSQESCRQDWQENDCERTPAAGGGHAWWGPYYSSAGRVYHYDGRTTHLAREPAHAIYRSGARLSPNEVYASGGKYVSTKAHPTATSAKTSVSRGGFGGRSGGFSGGG